MAKALVCDPSDNVATVLEDVAEGDTVTTEDGSLSFRAKGPVPKFHKVALADTEEGAAIIKYGNPIGTASARIRRGEHVHVHNMVSSRGRRG